MVSSLTRRGVRPWAKLTSAASASVHRLVGLPKVRGLWCNSAGGPRRRQRRRWSTSCAVVTKGLQHDETTLVEHMNSVAYGLVSAVQGACNRSRWLPLGTGEEYLAATYRKGGRGPETGLEGSPLVRRERAHKWCLHIQEYTTCPKIFIGIALERRAQRLPHRHPPRAQPVAPLRERPCRRPRLPPECGTAQAPLALRATPVAHTEAQPTPGLTMPRDAMPPPLFLPPGHGLITTRCSSEPIDMTAC